MTRAALARSTLALAGWSLVAGLSFVQCSQGPPAPLLSAPAERGRSQFAIHCAACHNAVDPHKNGLLGPALARASKELLAAKVLTGEYPAGYQPKQATKQMVPLPHVKEQLDDIAAFLAEVPAR